MRNWKLALLTALLMSGTGLIGCDAEEATGGDEQEQAEAESAQEVDEEAAADEEEEVGDDDEGAAAASEPVIGEMAPDFTLVDEAGETHSLSDYRGQTVVLEWFNFECPYVVRHYEEQTFGNILEEVGGTDEVAWLAIDTTYNRDVDDTLAWKEETADSRPFDYPILQDPDGEVGRLYDAKTTPHMFVIDEEGVLQYMGGIDDDPRGSEDVDDRTHYVLDALTAMAAGEEVETTEAEPYGCTVKYDEES